MGDTYTRQSSSEIVDGEVINAADFNNEFNQLVSAFAASTGHTHDGTTAEGGPITKLLGTAITIGNGASGTDIAVTFDGETSDGVLTWMEDEDQFKFSDDIMIVDDEQLIFGSDSNVAISYDETTTDSLKIAATEGAGLAITLMADEGDDAGDEWKLNIADGGTLTLGNDINSAGTYVTHLTLTPNATVANSTLAVAGNLTVANDLTITDDVLLDSDSAVLKFGDDQEVTVTHVADTGLNFKHTATGDDKPIVLTLQTGETDIAADDVIGRIDFQAPDETTGTDAILVAAGIAAVSEGDFSSSNNATKLSFKTAASEAACEKMSLSSAGVLTTSSNIVSGGNVVVADAGNIGSASDTDALAISSGGVVTFSQKPVINSGVAIDNITIDGTEIDLSSGDLTVDVAGDITLDAGGADINLADDGTTFGTFTNSSSDFVIDAAVQDKDIIFKGDDGGSAITSLTLDMSNSGAAIFSAAAYNAEATLTDASTISWNAITQPVAKVTLGANRTLGAASGGVAGQFVSLLIIQDGTGSRTVTFNAAYEFASDTAPTLTTTASKGDLFVFRYNGSKWLEVGRNLNLTLS